MTIKELRKRYHNLLTNEAGISDTRELKNANLEVWSKMSYDLMSDINNKISDSRISGKTYNSLMKLYYETGVLLARYMIYYNTNNGNSTEYWERVLKSDIDILKFY